jgi:hypothetical protein
MKWARSSSWKGVQGAAGQEAERRVGMFYRPRAGGDRAVPLPFLSMFILAFALTSLSSADTTLETCVSTELTSIQSAFTDIAALTVRP